MIRKAITFRASSIGDALMAKYLLENIRAQHPSARLGLVASGRSAMLRELLSGYPWIEVVEANRRSPAALWKLWKQWRGSDVVVTQYAGRHGGAFGLPSKLAARLLARRGGLVGFEDAARGVNALLYDRLLPVRPDRAVAEHEREALRAAGLAVPLPYPTFSHIRSEGVEKKYGVAKPYAVLHAFAGNGKGRSMRPERARELLMRLRALMPGTQFVVTAGKSEKADAERIAGAEAKVLAGVPLQDVANILAGASVVVSVDTGIAHMAAQMHAPLVVVATCLGPNWWFPEQYGPEAPLAFFTAPVHRPEEHIYVDYPECLNEVDEREVAQAAAALAKK